MYRSQFSVLGPVLGGPETGLPSNQKFTATPCRVVRMERPLFHSDLSFARLGNARDEWGLLPPEDANHVAESGDQHFCHLCSAVIAGTEVELANLVLADCCLFQFVIPDTFVFREQYPAFLTNEGKPFCVFRAGSKVLPVTLVLYAVLDERIENGFAVVKIFVEIKNEVFRQR